MQRVELPVGEYIQFMTDFNPRETDEPGQICLLTTHSGGTNLVCVLVEGRCAVRERPSFETMQGLVADLTLGEPKPFNTWCKRPGHHLTWRRAS